MITTLHFDQVYGGALCCIWQDEMRFFPDCASAERWAARQGFKATFGDSDALVDSAICGAERGGVDAEGVRYEFLGLTGLEDG